MRRAHALHHRHQPPGRDGRHLPQRPARPRAAGHLLRRARAPRPRGHGGAAGDARRRGAGARAAASEQLTAVRFDQFVFDLSELIRDEKARACRGRRSTRCATLLARHARDARERPLRRSPTSSPRRTTRSACRFSAMIYPMIALVTLLAGGYRRSGFGKRVVVAIAVATLPADPHLRRPRPGAGARRALAAHVRAGAARGRLPRRAARPAQPRPRRAAGGAGMTLCRYILRGFLRAVARRLRRDRARHPALHLGREPAPLRRSGRQRRRRAAHHAAAGAGGALPGVSRWC